MVPALETELWLRLISFVSFNKLLSASGSQCLHLYKIGKMELTWDLAWEKHFSSLSLNCKIGLIMMLPPL